MERFDKTKVNWPVVYAGAFPAMVLSHTKHQPCPYCGGKDRFRLFSDWPETGAAICGQCGDGDGIYWLMKILGLNFTEVVNQLQCEQRVINDKPTAIHSYVKTTAQETERRRCNLEQVLQSAEPLCLQQKNAATQYLINRGLGLLVNRNDELQNLFYSPSLAYYHEDGRRELFKGLLAALHDVDGALIGVHRIYLSSDGQKAPVAQPKKSMRPLTDGALHGTAVRLNRPSPSLCITEGIETALAVRCMHAQIPVWATLTTGGMKALRLPAEICDVKIFADHDANGAGIDAANELAKRLIREGRQVKIKSPEKHLPRGCFGDWLDVWCMEAN